MCLTMGEKQSSVHNINGYETETQQETYLKAKLTQIHVTDYMENCLDKVALAQGFKNYIIKVVHGSNVGEGFVGLIFKVTINEEKSDKSLNLILKTLPANRYRRIQFGSTDLFRREVFVYNEFLPEVVKFQNEKNISKHLGFCEFPKVYYAEYNEEIQDALIIMEDLKEKGFLLWDKFEPTPYENAKLIMQALGKLHAVSFAMKIFKPELFDKFKQMNDNMYQRCVLDEQLPLIFKNYCDQAISILDDNPKLKSKIIHMRDSFEQVLASITEGKLAEPYAVVTHGDCWSNNILYQYRGGNPSHICLIDFQVSRYSSPVLDLVYFLFTSTSGEMRAAHYDELLGIYHRSLKDLLDHMGGDTQLQFPFTALLRQLKQFGKFGAMMSVFLIPMLTTRNEDLPDIEDAAEIVDEIHNNPELMKKMMSDLMKPRESYLNRIKPTLLDLMRLGYI